MIPVEKSLKILIMIFDLNNPYDIEKYKEYVNRLFEQRATVEVKKKHLGRSLSQNNYMHALLAFFACEYGCSIDEAKVDFFKRTCNKDLFERIRENKSGNPISYLRSSAELTTGEMTTAIERFRNWSAAVAGIYLPSPDEKDFLLYAQKVIEQNKEFI